MKCAFSYISKTSLVSSFTLLYVIHAVYRLLFGFVARNYISDFIYYIYFFDISILDPKRHFESHFVVLFPS